MPGSDVLWVSVPAVVFGPGTVGEGVVKLTEAGDSLGREIVKHFLPCRGRWPFARYQDSPMLLRGGTGGLRWRAWW